MNEIIRNFRLENSNATEDGNYQKLLESKDVVHLNRGIKLRDLTKILKVKIARPEFRSVLEGLAIKIFVVGSKSNYYIGSKVGVDSDHIHNRVEDIDNETFSRLHEKLIEVFIKRPLVKPSVERFITQNKDFITNLKISNFNNIEMLSSYEKTLIRDYYLALLHQVFDKRYHSKSALISTSKIEKEVTKFRGDEGILIKYFIPNDLTFALTVPPYCMEVGEAVDLIRSLKLPSINTPPFIEQSEYSVKRALFPHFL